MNSHDIKRRNRALILVGLNLACWPGLGTLLSRRWISGALQMAVFVTGFLFATPPMLRYLVEAARGIQPRKFRQWRGVPSLQARRFVSRRGCGRCKVPSASCAN